MPGGGASTSSALKIARGVAPTASARSPSARRQAPAASISGRPRVAEMDMREAFVAARPLLRRPVDIADDVGRDAFAAGGRKQRQYGVFLAFQRKTRRSAAMCRHPRDKRISAETQSMIGEGELPPLRRFRRKPMEIFAGVFVGLHDSHPSQRSIAKG